VVTGEESLSARMAQITDGRGADLVYDCVGGALTNEIVSAIATNGKWMMYGFLDPSPVTVNWPMWFMRQPSLHMFSLTQFVGSNELGLLGRPIEFDQAVRTVLSLCGNGELPIPVAQTFQGIEAVRDAFRAMEANLGGGKIVVRF
jgi:NADPH:quinone reductase-like Zn-dependent oxidoreductase